MEGNADICCKGLSKAGEQIRDKRYNLVAGKGDKRDYLEMHLLFPTTHQWIGLASCGKERQWITVHHQRIDGLGQTHPLSMNPCRRFRQQENRQRDPVWFYRRISQRER